MTISTKDGITARKFLRYGLQGAILALVVTIAIIVLTMAPDTLRQAGQIKLAFIPLVLLLVAGAWLCFAGRISLSAKALGYHVRYRDAVKIALSTEFGCAASPAGVGGAVVRLALLRACGIPVALSTTMVAADVLLDTVFFVLMTPFALWVLVFDPEWSSLFVVALNGKWWLVGVVVALPLPVAGMLLLRRGSWYRDAHWLSSKIPGSTRFRLPLRVRFLRTRLRSEWKKVTTSAVFLYRERRSVLALNFVLTCIQWSCRYGVLPLVLLSFSCTRNPLPLMFVQAILLGVAFLLVAPGGGGVVELLSLVVLPLFVPRSMIGLALLFWRFFSYYIQLLVGGPVFLWTIRHLDRLRSRP